MDKIHITDSVLSPKKMIYEIPELVWDRLIYYMGPQQLYTLTRKMPKLLRIGAIEWEVNEFKGRNPYACRECTNRFASVVILRAHRDLAHPVPIEEQLRRFFTIEWK